MELEYSNSKIPIDKREDDLNRLIERLDIESYNLYSEVVDLGEDSTYKIEELKERLRTMIELNGEAAAAYKYLTELEGKNIDFAHKRFKFKGLITAGLTINAFTLNPLFGIESFILLFLKSIKDLIKELKEIEDGNASFNPDKMLLVARTLENSNRMLYGKILKIKEKSYYNEFDYATLCANDIIQLYLSGNIDIERIDLMTRNTSVLNKIISILKQDLNSDSNNLYELLELAKEKSEKGKSLIKEYKTKSVSK